MYLWLVLTPAATIGFGVTMPRPHLAGVILSNSHQGSLVVSGPCASATALPPTNQAVSYSRSTGRQNHVKNSHQHIGLADALVTTAYLPTRCPSVTTLWFVARWSTPVPGLAAVSSASTIELRLSLAPTWRGHLRLGAIATGIIQRLPTSAALHTPLGASESLSSSSIALNNCPKNTRLRDALPDADTLGCMARCSPHAPSAVYRGLTRQVQFRLFITLGNVTGCGYFLLSGSH